jgi:carboxymethylenebutenolidase
MCYDDQALPPIPPGEPKPITFADYTLEASDGNRFAAFSAEPANPAAAVLIYPDVRGLHQFYKELAMRIAEAGYGALALDYFGRTAGLTKRDESFEFMPHVGQLKIETFELDVQAALAQMRATYGLDIPIYVVGFCMGGSLTFITGTNKGHGFRGLIPFYAGLSRDFGGRGTVLSMAEKVAYPVCAFFGGADQGIPPEQVAELDHKLDTAGVAHHLETYPGAPHSFFDRRATDYADASADAWKRLLAFIEKGGAF